MDGITVNWVISQVFAVAEYALLGASYLSKRRKLVVVLDIFSMICGIISFIFLGAYTGIVMSVIVLLANFYYLWDENVRSEKERSKLHRQDYIVLAIILTAIAVASIWSYEGLKSWFSIIATTLYEISIWQKSTKVYKILGIPVALNWMIYNGLESSIFGVICEIGMLAASIVGYVRELQAQKAKQRKKVARKTAKKLAK